MDGLDSLITFLSMLDSCIINGSKIGVTKAAFKCERIIKQTAPTDTGNLKQSVFTQIEDGGLDAYIGPNVFYALTL